jgi:serine/threonine protein kinase
MSDKKFERFGKYLILDHLVDGGMAKICRARFLGEQANKIVAIKMVQPQFSKDPSFVQMFEDELKVTFGLLHPNIAQMYDYGIVNEQLYTAMEYVDGANLKQYLDRLKDKNFVFPVEISTYITSQVCQALHYAHTFTDKLTGKPFNIIHRDISPHNIMLTYDGALKVIDFGIAKADSNSEATQAGTIKGKLSYLAPEYLDGLQLDHRYDQFAVGITLWELLCSRKLFQASNDLAVLKQIQACKIPAPSSINPNVPKELDQIVLKSLAKDRNQRFENMDKFNRALVKFLYSNYPDFNATDLGYFAKQLFKEEIASDKEKFQVYGQIDIKPYLEDLKKDMEGGTGSSGETPSGGPQLEGGGRTKKIEIDFGLGDDNSESEDGGISLGLELDTPMGSPAAKASAGATTSKRVSKARKAGGTTSSRRTVNRASGATKAGTRTTTRVRRKKSAGTSTRSVSKKKAVAQSSNDSSNSKLIPVVASVALAVFVYWQADLMKSLTGVDFPGIFGKESKSEPVVANNSSDVSVDNVKREVVSHGKVRFQNYDPDMRIYINGSPAKMDGVEAIVPFNKKLAITIRKNGYKKFEAEKPIYLTISNDSELFRIPELEKEAVGILSTSQNFTSGSKLVMEVDGEVIEEDLPIGNMRVPAGVYNAVIKNPLLGTEREVKIDIKENKRFYLK